MSAIVDDAFSDLFPDKNPSEFRFSLKYTAQFKPYNANVRRRGNAIEFRFSRKWKTISREIQVGLVQELLVKLFKARKSTSNMDMYAHFMRSIHIAAPKIHSDPVLRQSFERNNDRFFGGMLDITNLKWGSMTTRKLGQYEYGSDMITISLILNEAPLELLDYVMYHEMLHKKLKFSCKNGRSLHHSAEFRRLESRFPDSARLEKDLSRLALGKRGVLARFLNY